MNQASTLARRRAHRWGVLAEQGACVWLRLKGYRLLERRLLTPFGEIDLLMRKGNTLVVVEVKARATLTDCLEAVTPAKGRRLCRAALSLQDKYIANSAGRGRGKPLNMRIDLIAITPRRGLRHVKNIWQE